jgi:ribonuclease P protein component
MDQRHPPTHRLHDGRDFSRVFNRQQKCAGRHVVVLLRPREARTSAARLGIMVAAKTVKTAVRRHQLKRWVRELFRTQLQQTLAGMDLVVLFRADPPEHGHRELAGEISELAARALTLKPQAGGRPRSQGSRGARAPGPRSAAQAR